MTRAFLLASVLCGGCLIVPAKTTSTRSLGTEDGLATFTKSRELVLAADLEGKTVRVQAKRIGECTQPVIAVSEITTTKRARLGGASDPRGRAFGLVLAPITIPISAIVTGFVVAADRPETSRQTRPYGIKRFACSLEAGQLTVKLTLPSGAIHERTTNSDGRIALEIPDTEPYEGNITISAPAAVQQQVAYSTPKPAVTAARDAVIGCAAQHRITGNITAKLSINGLGRVTNLSLSAGDAALNVCITKQLVGVRFPEASRSGTLTMPLVLPAVAASL